MTGTTSPSEGGTAVFNWEIESKGGDRVTLNVATRGQSTRYSLYAYNPLTAQDLRDLADLIDELLKYSGEADEN